MPPAILLFLILITACTGNKDIPPDRIVSLSKESPFANLFDKKKQRKDAIRTVLRILEEIAEVNSRRVKSWYYGAIEEYPCNIPMDESLLEGLNNTLVKRGLGDFYRPCAAEMSLEHNTKIVDALHSYFDALEDIKLEVLQSLKGQLKKRQSNWKTAYTYYSFPFSDLMHRCTVHHVTALRIKGVWALTTQLTNAPPTKPLSDGRRQYLSENVYVDHRDKLRSFSMSFGGHNGTTTALSYWGGRPSSSRFTSQISMEHNPSVLQALRKQWRSRKQAENLVTASNIAILLLPLATSIVPVSLFAETSTVATILYVVLTDIAAMMPLAIKGFELKEFSRVNLEATRFRIFGAVEKKDTGAAELWHAECKNKNHLYVKGVSLICIAVSLMILGIVLEIVARIKLDKDKRRIVETKLISIKLRVLERYQLQRSIRARWMQCEVCGPELCLFSEKHVGLNIYPIEYDQASTHIRLKNVL